MLYENTNIVNYANCDSVFVERAQASEVMNSRFYYLSIISIIILKTFVTSLALLKVMLPCGLKSQIILEDLCNNQKYGKPSPHFPFSIGNNFQLI